MTSTLVESEPWSRRRRWGLVALIFGVQIGLIFWLGDHKPIRPRPAAPAFTFKLAGKTSAEMLALNDPTLFALPQRQTPAGLASQRTLRPGAPTFQWPEPTNSLLLAVGQLGAVFSRFIETNASDSLHLPATLKPTLTLPSLPTLAVSAEQSTLLLEGDLAQRRLVTPLPLRSWPNPDILTNSVVRLAVDSEGRPVSPTLLSSSGSTAADQYALELARAARFEPVRRNPADPALKPAADLSLVRMTFRWHTLPPPPTNSPAASP
jgi:TonB family protein